MLISETLFLLLKSALTGQKLNTDLPANISSDAELFALASSHSVANVAAEGLGLNGIDIGGSKFERSAIAAVQSDAQIEFELSDIRLALEAAGVPFIPLKALVLKKYYPKPHYRTCGDMDILVRREDIGKAVNALVSECGYTAQSYNHHDVALVSPYNVPLELHFSTSYDEEKPDAVLVRIWDYAVPADNGCEYKLTDEFFLFYTIAHIYHHFVTGGCGIRFFMDLWVITHRMGIRYTYEVQKLCGEAAIGRFAECALHLSEVWFGEAAHTKLTGAMEEYILSGGTFGSRANEAARVSVTAKKKGRIRYNLQRMLLPYGKLKLLYPTMKAWQFPAYEMKRWGELLKKGTKHRMGIAQKSRELTEDKSESVRKLFAELGIR